MQGRDSTQRGWVLTDGVVSDSEGRFRIDKLARQANTLVVSPRKVPWREYRIDDYPDPCSMTLVVPRYGDIRIELGELSGKVDGIALLDTKGNRLGMGTHVHDGWKGPFETMSMDGGASGWIIAPDDESPSYY